MKYNGAEITIKLLEMHGIDTIAGIPGGANLPLYDALYKSNISHVLARHEQGAAFIAQGIARSTGRPAVCFATSGPGATNLITAIADAKLDSVPIIAITGQVPYSLIGTDAFQEVDTYGLTLPIAKHNFLVHSINDLFSIIPEAFNIAQDGRPGPVVIDIPKNIQTEVLEFEEWPQLEKKASARSFLDVSQIQPIVKMIHNAKKPILYVGGGMIHSNASRALYKFAEKNNIPVAVTLMGLGCFPTDHALYLGLVGMHGARYTNLLMHESDLVLAFGVRFDDRATGNVSKFCPNAKILHIEVDEAEINKLKSSHHSIQGDIGSILEDLTPYIENMPRLEWIQEIEKYKIEYPFVLPNEDDVFHPINIIKYVSRNVPEDSIIVTDVGQHQMWTAQVYPFKYPRNLLTSGGLGTMGFGLPSAIGAALANPNRQTICFSGDGSILMNIQELATLADLHLNIKVIILNNGHLGLVRQQQQLFYEEHYIASKFIRNPDFATIAKGFGIPSCNIAEEGGLDTLAEILSEKGPYLINIPIRQTENVLPMVPPGAANTEMIGGEHHAK